MENNIFKIDGKEWKYEYRKIKDLIPLKKNPRKITDKQLESLEKKIKEVGFNDVIKLDNENNILSGNQRKKILTKIANSGGGELEIMCAIPQYELTEREKQQVIITSNIADGEFDYDLMDDYNLDDLKDWGVDLEKDLKLLDNEIYTTKIETPIYEPIGWDISLKDCLNTEKGEEYIREIENSDIQDKELKDFLLASATRLYEFNFKNIAEYYSKITDNKIKNLFEKLALVIIDSEKAIENGYIEMVEQLKNLFKEENKKEMNE